MQTSGLIIEQNVCTKSCRQYCRRKCSDVALQAPGYSVHRIHNMTRKAFWTPGLVGDYKEIEPGISTPFQPFLGMWRSGIRADEVLL